MCSQGTPEIGINAPSLDIYQRMTQYGTQTANTAPYDTKVNLSLDIFLQTFL